MHVGFFPIRIFFIKKNHNQAEISKNFENAQNIPRLTIREERLLFAHFGFLYLVEYTRHALLPSYYFIRSNFASSKFTIDNGVHISTAQTKIVNISPKYPINHEWTKYLIE